jgi:hypothetical protein
MTENMIATPKGPTAGSQSLQRFIRTGGKEIPAARSTAPSLATQATTMRREESTNIMTDTTMGTRAPRDLVSAAPLIPNSGARPSSCGMRFFEVTWKWIELIKPRT